MIRIKLNLPLAALCLVCGVAHAQSLPPDLSALPDTIKNLSWQRIDVSALSPLQRCRALLLLNHALDETAALGANQADLMSQFIQEQNLGPQFASSSPPGTGRQLSFDDAVKIAAAMLQGPMADSSFALALSDASPTSLTAYQQMYRETCQRRWSETAESRHQVRAMGAFLRAQGKLDVYKAWAKEESALRQQTYQQQMAARQQQANAQQIAEQQKKVEAELQQFRQSLAVANHQQQQVMQQQAQNPPPQQQANMQNQPQQQSQPGYPLTQPEAPGLIPGAEDPDYGPYSYYGGYYSPTYYSNDRATYAYDYAASNTSRMNTEQRMSSWHGAPGVGAGRYRR